MRNYRSPDLDKIVGRHLQSWELRREVSERRRREEGAITAALGPYLSVSRLPFAGGDEVAVRCAELLGWELFDREIVDHIARDARVLGKFVASLDENSRSAMDDLIQTTLDSSSLGHVAYLRHLKHVLLTLALHGNAVLVGRGANFILPPEAGLRVMITAPPSRRLAALARQQDLDAREAARVLRELDQRRRDFLRTHFLHAGQELDHYDLIVNLDQMDVDEAATLVVDAFYTLDRRTLPRRAG